MENSTENKRPQKSVARSTALMSACTLVSRITGFVRTWAMAFALGNTILAAGFSLANNLPNMIYELVAGGVLSTAFLPIYLQQRDRRDNEAASLYASNLFSITLIVMGVIALVASIFAPQFMATQSLFSSASDETVETAVWLFRFLAFEIVFYGISAIFSGLLNAEREFFWPAISSVFMNIIAIIGFFGYPFISSLGSSIALSWLGITMLLSIAVMAFVQLPALKKTGVRLRFYVDLHGEGLGATLRLALPAIACTAINLVALSFMNSCALHVADNGPSSVSYAWMWYQFPYGVLGVALSTAMFTEMSECTARRDFDGFRANLLKGLRTTWLLIIPMAALVCACADDLIGLYTAGKFTAEDIAPIAALLQGWAINLPIYAGYMFVYRAYSAMKDMKTVAICNFILTFVQVGLYMYFTGVIGPGGVGLWGIAVADIVFYGLMLVVLLVILSRRASGLGVLSLGVPVIKISVASLIGGVVAWLMDFVMGMVFPMATNMGIAFVSLCIRGIVALAAVIIVARVLRVDEIANVLSSVLRKIKRS